MSELVTTYPRAIEAAVKECKFVSLCSRLYNICHVTSTFLVSSESEKRYLNYSFFARANSAHIHHVISNNIAYAISNIINE